MKLESLEQALDATLNKANYFCVAYLRVLHFTTSRILARQKVVRVVHHCDWKEQIRPFELEDFVARQVLTDKAAIRRLHRSITTKPACRWVSDEFFFWETGFGKADRAVSHLELMDDLLLAASSHLRNRAAEGRLRAQYRHVAGQGLAMGGVDGLPHAIIVLQMVLGLGSGGVQVLLWVHKVHSPLFEVPAVPRPHSVHIEEMLD